MISVVILTHNEADNLRKLLPTLSWCKDIIVIDDASTDETREIARKFNAKVYTRKLDGNFAKQRNYGLSKTSNEWVLFVDADERISKKLVSEIEIITRRNSLVGYFLKRSDVFLGKQLMYGETAAVRLLRLAKKSAGAWVGAVHETWNVTGETGELSTPLTHYSHRTVGELFETVSRYARLEARARVQAGKKFHLFQQLFYPLAKFVQNYFVRKGFLDGIPGLLMAFAMSYHSWSVRTFHWDLLRSVGLLGIIQFLVLVWALVVPFGQLNRIQLTQSISVYVFEIIMAIISSLWIGYSFKRKLRIFLIPLIRPVVIFLLVLLLSLTIRIPQYGWEILPISLYWWRLVLYATFFIALYDLKKRSAFPISTSGTLLYWGALITIFGFLQYVLLPDTRFLYYLGWDDHLNRLISTLLDPGFTGVVLVLFLIYLDLTTTPKKLTPVVFIALLLTYARSAFLAYLGAVLVSSFFRRSVRYLFLRLMPFVLLLLLLPKTAGEGVQLGRTASIVSRVESTLSAWTLFTENPLLGIGFNTYPYYLTQNSPSPYPVHPHAPDNSFLFILTTSGIVGFISFSWFVGEALILARKSQLLFITILIVLAHSLTNNTLFYPWIMMWVCLVGLGTVRSTSNT